MKSKAYTVLAVLTIVFAAQGCTQGETRAGKNLSVLSTDYDSSGNKDYNVVHYKDQNDGKCWASVAGNDYYINEEPCK